MEELALVVDDQPNAAQYIADHLVTFGYAVDVATTTQQAQKLLNIKRYNIACLDVYLNDETKGYELAREILKDSTERPPTAVVYVTGSYNAQTVHNCWDVGGEDYLVKPVDPDQLLSAVRKAQERAERRWCERLFRAARGLLGTFVAIKDEETLQHSLRVGRAVLRSARFFGWSFEERIIAYLAAVLHDVGKAYIGTILCSPTLTDHWTQDDIDKLKHHPTVGAEAARAAGLPERIAQIIKRHHERPDGQGYPEKLTMCDLSPTDLLVAAADVTDALLSNRPYRQALPKKAAADELRKIAGWQIASNWANFFAQLIDEDRQQDFFNTPLTNGELDPQRTPTDWDVYR